MNSLNTLLPRLNTAETQDALATIRVAVRNTNDEFRSATDIYSDVASKWDSMSRSTKAYIAESLAGCNFYCLIYGEESYKESCELLEYPKAV